MYRMSFMYSLAHRVMHMLRWQRVTVTVEYVEGYLASVARCSSCGEFCAQSLRRHYFFSDELRAKHLLGKRRIFKLNDEYDG